MSSRRAEWAVRLSSTFGLAWLLVACAGGCRAEPRPWPLWEAYTARFLDDQGRVIDRSMQDRTTSEGQAYAMFFALVDNDHKRFDKLLAWTEANLAGGDLTVRLPAWAWGRHADGQWSTMDQNSAADADLWLAYSLLEAGRLWREPRYDALARTLLARIAREEVALVPGAGTTLLPGPHGFHAEEQTWVLNPSYLPAPLLARFAGELPQGPWAGVAGSLPVLLEVPTSHGFAMDWVAVSSSGVRAGTPPAVPTAGTQEKHAAGSYDAIRVYLWLGLSDPRTAGVADALAATNGMAAYLRTASLPPLEVSSDGTVVRADGPPGFSAATIPFLDRTGLKAQAKVQQDRLLATKDAKSGLYGQSGNYYDQNLALFSTGWSEQRFRFGRDGKLWVSWK